MEVVRKSIPRELLDWTIALLISGTMIAVMNLVGFKVNIGESVPGILLLIGFCLGGLLLNRILPFSIPAVAYISLIAMVAALPFSPISEMVILYVGKINTLATTTAILAYAGVVIGHDWPQFRKIGYKGIIVSLLVIFGTFFFSALVAEFFLRL